MFESPSDYIDRIFQEDCRDLLRKLPSESIPLLITSPPYNVGKEYEKNLTLDEYLSFLREVFQEAYRVLSIGGRCCVNLANVDVQPCIPLSSHVCLLLIELGYLMRGTILWDKGASVGVSTAWGSWQSASNPVLRADPEYVLIFSKKEFTRPCPDGGKDTITKEQFLEWTKSIWEVQTETSIEHPAPFPVELPRRLMQLFSFQNDLVLDPFMGSGTTAVAAIRNHRHFVGAELDPRYCQIANSRIDEEHRSLLFECEDVVFSFQGKRKRKKVLFPD